MAQIEQGGVNFNGSVTIGTVNIAPYTIVGNGVTTVSTAGSAVQLSASSTPTGSITIRALSTNTGIIFVGSSSVSSANGFELSADEVVSLDLNNLNKVYLDCSVNGEGVSYIYVV